MFDILKRITMNPKHVLHTPSGPAGWRNWFVASLLHLRLQIKFRLMSEDFKDAKNRQCLGQKQNQPQTVDQPTTHCNVGPSVSEHTVQRILLDVKLHSKRFICVSLLTKRYCQLHLQRTLEHRDRTMGTLLGSTLDTKIELRLFNMLTSSSLRNVVLSDRVHLSFHRKTTQISKYPMSEYVDFA
ncbi:hypothetical protein TNCV_2200961 [Trichonephila clavipes]|nr:hypothetical protein TNCV_2200961 [Trichonephila clavipes]